MYYRVREYCGAHLDPDESCDCGDSNDDEQDNNNTMEDML